jgi:predicted TPR repeat methyltransferase
LDLILAADVIIYIGELAPLFREIARVLADDGLFAFTAESGEGNGDVVNSKMRYAHLKIYIQRTAEQAGLSFRLLNAVPARRHKGVAVPSLIGVLAAPGMRHPLASPSAGA